MLYYSLEPQFSALIFSISARNEKISLFPDALACYAHGPGWAGSDVVPYVHTLGVQLAALGDHYACLLTQVRAGSVIFLVGVGSLVCWKLWEHWRAGGGCSPPLLPPPPPSPPSKHSAQDAKGRPRGILASLLEEDLIQDPDDFEDEDPAFIHGKYFGPSSPCDEASLSTDLSEAGSEALKHYLADASASYNHGDEGVVSSSEASLPTDEDSDAEVAGGSNGSNGGGRRVVRRRHRVSHHHRHHTPTSLPATLPTHTTGRRHVENGHPASAPASCHPLQDDWISSESSPESHLIIRHHRAARHHHPPSSITPEAEELVSCEVERRQRLLNMPRRRDEEALWGGNSRGEMQCDDDGLPNMRDSVSSASLADLMEKLRQRAQRGQSLSRDNSVASNLSELLMSPLGTRRFPFKREDSVCSNLSGVSDMAPSECSEASLDVSVKDDLAASTMTCLDNIEHELDDLKSSMIEMDQEVTKFTSRPDPYTFKTTYSDYSVGSGDSRPPSAMEVSSPTRARFTPQLAQPNKGVVLSDADVADSDTCQQVASEASGSMEWDSPQHGWSSSRPRPVSLPPSLPSHNGNSRSAPQDDTMPSLEWDNGCLRQYTEEQTIASAQTLDDVFHATAQDSLADLEGFEEYKLEHSRHQLLPDHSSLELDLEEELQCPPEEDAQVTEWGNLPASAPMTTSVDSAIHSGPSRSNSSSPLPPGLGRSLLSSSGLASSCEISPATPDSEGSSGGWGWWERRGGGGGPGGDWGSKSRRLWSSEESGFMDAPDAPLQQLPHDITAHVHLSPLHEIKEKESSDSSNSTPLHKVINHLHANKNNCTSLEENNKINSAANKNEAAELKNKNESAEVNKNGTVELNVNRAAGVKNKNEAAGLNANSHLDPNQINNNFIMGNKSSSTRRTSAPSHLAVDNQGRPGSTARDNEGRTVGDNELTTNSMAGKELPVAIGVRIGLEEYADNEWQGTTPKALTMRQGYTAIPGELTFTHMRRIRGDNYCGVRAAVYQALATGVSLPPATPTLDRLAAHLAQGANWLRGWTFAHRLNVNKDGDIVDTFRQCLDALESLGSRVAGCENRESVVSGALNGDPKLDVRVCEAIKLHMMAAALDLHAASVRGESVPLFAMIMFARQSSSSPRQLLANHINPVGDSAGLEQDQHKIEMFLLGWSLGVTVRVVRPGSHGADDYICYYPDANLGVWPQVTLLAEDDRHYNVLVK